METTNPNQFEPRLAVHVLSDDPALSRTVLDLARKRGLPCREHDTLDALAAEAEAEGSGCVVFGSRFAADTLPDLLASTGSLYSVVVVTEQADVSSVVRMMQDGAVSVLHESCPTEDLVGAVEHALRVSGVRARVHNRFETVNSAVKQLSVREKTVLQAIVAGQINRSIANALDVSVRTVEGDRARIVDKFGASSTCEVVGQYAEYRLLNEIGYPTIGLRGGTLGAI